MDFKETSSPLQLEQTTIEWVLCSPHLDHIVLIAPEGQNYQEILSKQIMKEYNQTSSLYNTLSVVLDNTVLFEYKTREGGSGRL